MTDFATLRARLDALEAAQRARNGELPMYEHGRPVKAIRSWPDQPPYWITTKGYEMALEISKRAKARE